MRVASGVVSINYLFDSAGRWIAFRKRRYVFDRDSRWIGWTPWDDNEVYSPNGSYLGTITYGNRLYCYRQREERGTPGTIEPPPFPGTYSEPPSPGRAVLLPWATDLDFSFHAELDWSSDLGTGVEQNMIFGHQPDPRSRRQATPAPTAEQRLSVIDLDSEFDFGDAEKTDIKTEIKKHDPRDNERDERRVRSRSRYEDEYDDYNDRDYRTRPRSHYDDDDYYDDRDRRPSRPRSRYEDDYDDRDYRTRPRSRYEDDYDDRDYRSRPRNRYEDDYDDRRPSRPRSRYEDDYDDRDYRSRPRNRYEDDYDDRDYRSRPRSRYEDDYDDYDRRPNRAKSRYHEDDYEDDLPVRSSATRRNTEDDNAANRKKEIERLRLIISKHGQKADEDDTLSQPLKKTN